MGVTAAGDGAAAGSPGGADVTDVAGFLTRIGLPLLRETFDHEQISLDILAEMDHEALKEVGVHAYGHRHRILRGVEKTLTPRVAAAGRRVTRGGGGD